MSSFSDFFRSALVTGIVTFLHEVKTEIATGTLNKQTATSNAVDSLLNGVFAGADALASTQTNPLSTPQASINANNAVLTPQETQSTSQVVIASKTASLASKNAS